MSHYWEKSILYFTHVYYTGLSKRVFSPNIFCIFLQNFMYFLFVLSFQYDVIVIETTTLYNHYFHDCYLVIFNFILPLQRYLFVKIWKSHYKTIFWHILARSMVPERFWIVFLFKKLIKTNGKQLQNAIKKKKKIISGNLTSMMCNQFFCNFAVNVALSLWRFI